MEKVIVEITNKQPNYPVPYGLSYEAKGAYRQGKYVIVVGKLGERENTIRIKYPAKDVIITLV